MERAFPDGPPRVVVRVWADTFQGMTEEVNRWVRRLRNQRDPLTVGEQARLRSLIEGFSAVIGQREAQMAAWTYDKAATAALEALKVVAGAVPVWTAHITQVAAQASGLGGVVNLGAIAAAAEGRVGDLVKDFRRLTESTRVFLQSNLTQSLIAGEHPTDMARRIRQVVDVVPRRGQARSLLIARTTLARAYDVSSLDVYRVAADRGLVSGWRWVAADGCCPICAALSGTVFPVTQPTYRHPNCRCVVVPVSIYSDAAGTPIGDRFKPMPDTQALHDRLYVRGADTDWPTWDLRRDTQAA